MNSLLRLLIASAALAVSLAPLQSAAAQEARVIVKLRDSPSSLKRGLAAERTGKLAARVALPLRLIASAGDGIHAVKAAGIPSSELIARLSADTEVEYAVEDRLRTIRATPNDPLYADQWYLHSVQAAAIRADAAWEIGTGADSVVTAVIDTGARPDHPDLAPRMLPGYDFISESALSGDGDGRDADASDSGDFIDESDQANPELQAICGSTSLPLQSSSWHGTRVSGVIAAATNNSQGIAGVTWAGGILPLRALGKCGGFDSDIVAAMRWAGGLAVPGVPLNPNPARVLNLSLGANGPCTRPYQDAIDELRAAGVLVVASAGNETGPVESPGNCPGVLTVAGVRHVGTKVGYSSLGPEVSISAPAGNCVNSFLPCIFPINTSSNSGTTQPASSIYTDGNAPNIGTSFSAPQVAGVAALMLALNPALTTDELVARIRANARPFPTDETIPTCPQTATGGETTGQCNCTTSTCGAGLLDAAAALAAAAPPMAGIAAPATPVAGTLITLDAGGSEAASGRRIVDWQWRLVASPAGASLSSTDTVTTALQAPVSGTYVVAVVVTDDLGASDEAVLSITVAEPSPAPPATGDAGQGSNGGGGGGGATDLITLLVLLAIACGALLARRADAQASDEASVDHLGQSGEGS